jgi:hypothetical protein
MVEDANMGFFSLLAIQAAPLLMTLVRKGKITSFTYHRVYAVCLYLGYVAGTLRTVQSDQSDLLLFGGGLSILVNLGRRKLMLPNWLLWGALSYLTFAVYPLWLQPVVHELGLVPYVYSGRWFLYALVVLQFRQYAPLFQLSGATTSTADSAAFEGQTKSKNI